MESPRLGSTKLQILNVLRRNPSTVRDLALALNVTENAVRTHVLTLERDALVRPHGRRANARKPSIVYGLAPDADRLFAKPYGAVLTSVLDEVEERRGDAEVASIACAVGRELARARSARVAPLTGRARVAAIVQLINELGGLAELEEKDGHLFLHGYSCPLVAVVPSHPEICKLTQTFVEDLLGSGTVRECCDRAGDDVRCHFAIDL